MCRALIASSQSILRRGLKMLLEPTVKVVALANDTNGTVSFASSTLPDVAILDTACPEFDAFEAARGIHIISPQTRVIFLTLARDLPAPVEDLEAGIWGHVARSDDLQTLLQAIHETGVGNPYRRRANAGAKNHPRLSPRETEILICIAKGESMKDIATSLGLSVKTVEAHRNKTMAKLNIHDTATLVRYAIRANLVEP